MKVKEIAKAVTQGFSQPSQPTPKPTTVVEMPASESATPSSVEPKTELVQPAPTPQLNPRNRAFAEIAARANADADRNAAESVPSMDPAPDPEPAQPAAAAEPQPEPTPEPAPAAVAAPAVTEEPAAAPTPEIVQAQQQPAIDPNSEYEFTIDGVKTKFKGSQIVSFVQKGGAADYRLALATTALEMSRQQQPQAAATPQGAQQPAGASAAPEQALSPKQLAEMIQFGNPEQAEKAIAEITRRSQPVTLEDVQKLVAKAVPTVTRHEMSFQEATRFAQTEYGDLLADPYLSQLFFAEENKRRDAGNNKPYAELYREIGDDLRKHFNRPKPAAPGAAVVATTPALAAAPAPTRVERQAAKAAAPAAPRLASARLDGGAQQKAPKTREEIIRGMQESRGQRPVTAT